MNTFLDIFRPPEFPQDEEKTRAAYYLNAATLASLFVLTSLLTVRVSSGIELLTPSNLVFLVIIFVLLFVLLLGKSGYTTIASRLIILTLWSAATVLAINGNGSVGLQSSRYIVITVFAGLLLGYRTALSVAFISVLGISGASYYQSLGVIQLQSESYAVSAVQAVLPLLLSTVFAYLSTNSLQTAIKKARDEAQEIIKSNKTLKELQETLETKVAERTENLLQANVENKRRATQFQTVTQVAQKISSERDLDTLLGIITEVINAQFNYYHVGVYLNDDIEEYTILSAASSAAGKAMMERGYKIAINPSSLIGYAAKTGNARANSDMSNDTSFYFRVADLPDTHSAFALPLKSGSHVIGVLDVQSKDQNAFDQSEIEALTALANQITIAIQNTRMFAETQTALAESQLLYGTVVKQTWSANLQSKPQVGYRYSGVKPIAIKEEITTPEIVEALERENIAMTDPSRRAESNALAIPLKLRDTTIGVINVNFPMDTDIGDDEIDVLLAASQRIAIALENASLLEESQRRAKREQTISEMSSKIGASTEVETILKTAIQELSAHISSAQISIEIGSDDHE